MTGFSKSSRGIVFQGAQLSGSLSRRLLLPRNSSALSSFFYYFFTILTTRDDNVNLYLSMSNRDLHHGWHCSKQQHFYLFSSMGHFFRNSRHTPFDIKFYRYDGQSYGSGWYISLGEVLHLPPFFFISRLYTASLPFKKTLWPGKIPFFSTLLSTSNSELMIVLHYYGEERRL